MDAEVEVGRPAAGEEDPRADGAVARGEAGRRARAQVHAAHYGFDMQTPFADLPEALAADPGNAVEWRIHFHVPVFVDRFGPLSSTRTELEACLRLAHEQRITPHLEIETYTWEVLPDALKTRLSSSILREYDWVLSVLEGAPRVAEEERTADGP